MKTRRLPAFSDLAVLFIYAADLTHLFVCKEGGGGIKGKDYINYYPFRLLKVIVSRYFRGLKINFDE